MPISFKQNNEIPSDVGHPVQVLTYKQMFLLNSGSAIARQFVTESDKNVLPNRLISKATFIHHLMLNSSEF